MRFRMEFPDFPVEDMPQIPAGFEDWSWHNDACPSFTDESRRLRLWIDYREPEKRDLAGAHRFMLTRLTSERDPDEYEDVLTESDDYSEILEAIASHSTQE